MGVIANPLKEKLTRNCELEYLKGHIWWALQQTTDLISSLEDSLVSENWTSSSLRKSSWATIEVPMKTNAKEQIKVPNFPSAFISRFLLKGCNCFHSRAAHTGDSLIIRFLAQTLTLRVIQLYENFLKENMSDNKRISREGLVQILFDVRFIFDVLAGAFQDVTEWPEILKEAYNFLPAALQETTIDFNNPLKKNISGFISALKKHFEPIDLAFYEPRVQQYVQKSYLQNLVSLGYFINSKRLYTQAAKTSFDRPNIVPLVSPVARLPTLPIGSRKS